MRLKKVVRTPVLRVNSQFGSTAAAYRDGEGFYFCLSGLRIVLPTFPEDCKEFRLAFSLKHSPSAVRVTLLVGGNVQSFWGCVYVPIMTRASLGILGVKLLGRVPQVGDSIFVRVEKHDQVE